MPRKPRYYIPDIPSHIIHRGINRQDCFFSRDDYRIYLQYLASACKSFHCHLHAYALMTNHIHLLMTPTTEDGISRVMHSVGCRYGRYINKIYRRTGSVWSGRHKVSLIQNHYYLFTCYKYIETNPVRTGIITHPRDYPWTSYRINAEGVINSVIQPHPNYLSLGNNDGERQAIYRDLFREELEDSELKAIRRAINQEIPFGNERFKLMIEAILGRRIQVNQRGRPKKSNLSVPAAIR